MTGCCLNYAAKSAIASIFRASLLHKHQPSAVRIAKWVIHVRIGHHTMQSAASARDYQGSAAREKDRRLLGWAINAANSLQTTGSGFVCRGQELREITVGVRFFGQAAQSGLHGGGPAEETPLSRSFPAQMDN